MSGAIQNHQKQMAMSNDLTGQIQEEFINYEIDTAISHVKEFDSKLQDWLMYYNTIRPHQSLGYMTPNNYLVQLQKGSA